MAHQCVRCNTFYDDGDEVVLKGCSCGAKLFFYIKDPKKIREQIVPEIPKSEIRRIEEDIKEMIGVEKIERPVILDLENIRIGGHGKYEIDLVKLFKGDPLVYKLEEGKYMIDVASSFSALRKKKNKK